MSNSRSDRGQGSASVVKSAKDLEEVRGVKATRGNFASLLKAHKLKVTPARLAILDAFSDGCEPMSAEIIFKKIKNQSVQHRSGLSDKSTQPIRSAINLVTVYRTIVSLEKAAVINRVDLHKDAVYYEFGHNHHHHIVCTKCGLIESFEECDIETISKRALSQSKKFKTIDRHSLEMFGICKICAR